MRLKKIEIQKIMKKIIQSISIILIYFGSNFAQGQFDIPVPPKKIYPIQDYAGVLSIKEIEKLNQKLILYSKITSTEILVPIIKDLHGEDPNLLASKWGEKWKIGKSYKDNGIIILLSIHDRKISIQNGYGIEPYMTDFLTMKTIKKIRPILKNNLYYKAIDYGTQEIFKILKNKYQNKQKNEKNKNSFIWNLLTNISIFSIMFFFFYFIFLKKRTYNSLINTLFLTHFLFKNKNYHDDNDDNFDGFGGGGNFGGGGGSSSW
ncbi:TPM domain-containing protein [Blattabacterium cuenoti]|uniref:TPM domain-containing protein n=1 Tax=Blattabacterium cuenoti TaxID=1653831 RepID=UPI001EEAC980|nr:TPM domain-containing protein [Blattabacterium cuenoti]